MSYAKKIGSASLYQGTSISVSVGKETKEAWEANEVGIFTLTDEINEEVLTGTLLKSADNLSLTAFIGKTASANYLGNYRLLAYQTDTNNDEVKVPIADFELEYSTTQADSNA